MSRWAIPYGLVFGAGVALSLIGTRWGPATTDDSFLYVAAARSFAHGHGLSVPTPQGGSEPLAIVAPGLPVLLGLLTALGLDTMVGARALNALLLGVNGVLTMRLAGDLWRSPLAGFLAGALFILSDLMIVVHTSLMSESLYLAFSLVGVSLLAQSLVQSEAKSLGAACVSISAAFFTRFAGLSLALAGVVAMWLHRTVPPRIRFRQSALLGAISLAPTVTWWLTTGSATGRVGGRVPGWYGIPAGMIEGIFRSVLEWYLPGRLIPGGAAIAIVLVGLATAGGAWAWISVSARRAGALPPRISWAPEWALVLVLYALFYLLVFLVARAFFEPRIVPDARLLSPLYPITLIFLTGLLARGATGVRLPMRMLVVIATAALFLTYGIRSNRTVRTLVQEGSGYSSRVYHESPTIAILQEVGDREIYSNAPAAIYFWAGRVTYGMRNLQRAKEAVIQRCGLLVAFHWIPLELYATSHAEVADGLLVDQKSDADIFYAQACGPELSTWLDVSP